MNPVYITGTGVWTPPETITNEELVDSFNRYVELQNQRHASEIASGTFNPLQPSSVEFIEKASGIKQRFVMEKRGILDPERMCPDIPERADEELSIMAEIGVKAAKQALDAAGCKAEEVDLVIVAASNHQRPYPAIAVEIQAALGCTGYGYDMNVACSSATFGMEQAANAIRSGQAKKALVLGPEICSAHLEWRDRDCHFIFGDVSTAVLLESRPVGWEIVGSKAATVFSSNIRNNAGFLNRCDPSGIGARDKLFYQEGRKVFKEVCPMAADHIAGHLADTNMTPRQVRRFWLHQANLGMNQLIARKLLDRDATLDDAPVILDRYANTASAGSIIAFHEHSDDLKSGDVGVICSFGAGYSIGSHVVRKI
jgi:beta-ketodecanoyl-[acyl-carrier-protein] synthase